MVGELILGGLCMKKAYLILIPIILILVTSIFSLGCKTSSIIPTTTTVAATTTTTAAPTTTTTTTSTTTTSTSTTTTTTTSTTTTTLDTTAPAAPSGLSATPTGNAKMSLSWSANSESDLAGYNVYRSTSSGGTYSKINSSTITTTSYEDSGLSSATTYYYKIKAVDTADNESEYSDVASATTSYTTFLGVNLGYILSEVEAVLGTGTEGATVGLVKWYWFQSSTRGVAFETTNNTAALIGTTATGVVLAEISVGNTDVYVRSKHGDPDTETASTGFYTWIYESKNLRYVFSDSTDQVTSVSIIDNAYF